MATKKIVVLGGSAAGAKAFRLPVDAMLQQWFTAISGIQPGPLLQDTILIVLGAYLVRFLAVGYGPIDSVMQNIKPSPPAGCLNGSAMRAGACYCSQQKTGLKSDLGR